MAKKIIKQSELAHNAPLEQRLQAGVTSAGVSVVTSEGGVVSRQVLEAKARAEAIMTDAQARAAALRHEAEALLAQVEQVRAEAKSHGYAEGREAGMADATEFLVRFQQLKAAFYEQAEREIRKLIITTAEKVVGRLTETHQELIVSIVRQAIEAAIGDRLTVRVNPADYAIVQGGQAELTAILDRTRRLHIKEDESITRGGCVVETEVGTIDAQLETQLKAIRKALEL